MSGKVADAAAEMAIGLLRCGIGHLAEWYEVEHPLIGKLSGRLIELGPFCTVLNVDALPPVGLPAAIPYSQATGPRSARNVLFGPIAGSLHPSDQPVGPFQDPDMSYSLPFDPISPRADHSSRSPTSTGARRFGRKPK